jgi:hypothetical protein
MKTEMQVLERLSEIIVAQLQAHITGIDAEELEPLTKKNVSMFFIQPDYEHLESLSMGSDLAVMQATVFILCKGASNQTLVTRVFGYYTALYILLRQHQTLDGFIDFARITDMDYYPAVTASKTITAIEVSLQLQWSKDFS